MKADAAGPKKGKGVSGRQVCVPRRMRTEQTHGRANLFRLVLTCRMQLFETRQELFVDDDEAEVCVLP